MYLATMNGTVFWCELQDTFKSSLVVIPRNVGKSDVVGVQLSAPADVAHIAHESEKLPSLAQSPPDVSVCIRSTLDHPTFSGAKQSAVILFVIDAAE